MGCCSTQGRSIPERVLINRITRAIEIKSVNSFNTLFEALVEIKKDRNIINEKICDLHNISFNCLGYALWIGKVEMFSYLHQKYSASIQIMENLLNTGKTSSLHIICEKNYIDILGYYLPYYLEEIVEYPVIQEVSSMFKMDHSLLVRDACPQYLPVHTATFLENIGLLSYINDYFKDKSYIPRYLDMDYKEDITGENCVLIACRYSSYKMISFFHKTCKLNFRVKNNCGHNAINVLIDGSKDNDNGSCFNCLRYLVEIVGVDYEYMYQFNLHHVRDPDILDYLIRKLKEIGINTSKREIEISRMQSQAMFASKPDDDTVKIRGNYFLSELKYRNSASVDFQDDSKC